MKIDVTFHWADFNIYRDLEGIRFLAVEHVPRVGDLVDLVDYLGEVKWVRWRYPISGEPEVTIMLGSKD